MPRTKKQTGNEPANKQKGKKTCSCCHIEKNLTEYYLSYSPLYSLDQRVPVCKDCCKTSVLNNDGTINNKKFKQLLRNIDKPLYYDQLWSAEESIKRENGYLNDEEIEHHGKDILQKYFTLIVMRQDRARSYSDSENEGFVHQNTNRSLEERKKIIAKYRPLFEGGNGKEVEVSSSTTTATSTVDIEQEDLIYDDKWMGKYTQKDIDYLNKYYAGLERDYKIITENHRDYARKIAKASLQMDKAFDEMINGVDGADARYKNAREAFDTLSKSAKFSESTRSVNDVGISSFSKVAAMVEAHNWIPEHKPLKKDTIDEMIDYLSTITKSL